MHLQGFHRKQNEKETKNHFFFFWDNNLFFLFSLLCIDCKLLYVNYLCVWLYTLCILSASSSVLYV